MEPRADLHTHTTASDGELTPTEVVETASRAGLAAVAITDHDTADGVGEALAAGERFGIEVVPGVEISTVHDATTEPHILGYFVDHRNPNLVERLHTLKNARWDRGRLMVERLNAIGVPIEFERVAELADGGAVGRPHVAKALCEIGAASSMDSAFGRFLQEGGPGYVPRYKVCPFEAVAMIVDAGGVACCAHIAKLRRDDLVAELIEGGLAAIEVYHPDHSAAGSRFYKRYAEKRGLIATGGSDAHWAADVRRPRVGEVCVGYDVVLALKRAARGEESR